MPTDDPGWLGDLRWQGYPRLETPRGLSAPGGGDPPPRTAKAAEGDAARENEALRGKLEAMTRLVHEFDRRLAEAGSAYEGAVLEAESKQRQAALERERAAGELEALKGEAGRLTVRDAAREADLRLERERSLEAQKALLDARRKLEDMNGEAERLRAASSE